MSKILAIFVAIAIAAIAVINATGDINMIECSDKQCRTNCRVISKIPEDTCHSPPFRHGESMQAICSTAPPTGLCYYFAMFKINSTANASTNDCVDSNEKLQMYHQCDVCRDSMHKPGTFEKTTGCNSSTTMTLNFECNAGCTQCNKTHQVTEKKCVIPPGFPNAVEFSAPTRCTQQIQYIHYNNTDCKQDASTFIEKQFADVCYSFGQRSHLYHCA